MSLLAISSWVKAKHVCVQMPESEFLMTNNYKIKRTGDVG